MGAIVKEIFWKTEDIGLSYLFFHLLNILMSINPRRKRYAEIDILMTMLDGLGELIQFLLEDGDSSGT